MEIKGFEDYLIYPDGRVWSKPKKTKTNGHNGMFLKSRIDYKGYELVSLKHNKISYHKRVHRLLAIHYIPNPENKPEVDHINRIRDDNRIENLRWATSKEQCDNKKIQNNNKTGHRKISITRSGTYFVRTKVNKKQYGNKTFKSKIDAICYKYILLLKIKSNYYNNEC